RVPNPPARLRGRTGQHLVVGVHFPCGGPVPMTTRASQVLGTWNAASNRSIAPSVARRLLDVVAAAVGLLVLSPLLALLWLVVRLTSRGPAIYRQARVGRGRALCTPSPSRATRATYCGRA